MVILGVADPAIVPGPPAVIRLRGLAAGSTVIIVAATRLLAPPPGWE